jgi:hypothetical protein
VVWHTQGSGKSLLMAFFAGLVVKSPELGDPDQLVRAHPAQREELAAAGARARYGPLRQVRVQRSSDPLRIALELPV